MKYKSGIDWNEFLSKIDLVNNDEPIVIKNFLPSPEKLLSWEDVENVLNFRRFRWEIFNGSSKVELPQEQNNYLPPYYSKNVLQSYIKEGKTFIIINYSLYNLYTKIICSEIENLFPVTTDMHVYGSKGNTSSSFPYHCDRPANFILQTYGECEWKVFSNTPSSLMIETYRDPDVNKLNLKLHTTLTPGDMLYIPSRFYHAAFPKTPRLSVSIPCIPGVEGRIDKNNYQL